MRTPSRGWLIRHSAGPRTLSPTRRRTRSCRGASPPRTTIAREVRAEVAFDVASELFRRPRTNDLAPPRRAEPRLGEPGNGGHLLVRFPTPRPPSPGAKGTPGP